MNNATGLIAASVSAVVIIALMATYVQIMNYLDDKRYRLQKEIKEGTRTSEDIKICNKILFFLKFLTLQGLLFFACVFSLLALTGALILETLGNRPVILFFSFIPLAILFVSQILHCIVFCKSYWKFVSKEKEPGREQQGPTVL